MPRRKTIMISPAPGWYAVYLQAHLGNKDTEPYYLSALACWALVRDPDLDDDEVVVGMDGGDYIDFSDRNGNLHVYVHESEITPEMRAAWVEEAAREVEREAARKAKKP